MPFYKITLFIYTYNRFPIETGFVGHSEIVEQ